jgi:hypothetical protein
MKGLTALQSTRPTATGRGVIPSIWRGSIVETYTDGTVAALIPNLLGDQAVRMPCVVTGLTIGAPVLIAAIEGRIDDLIVITPG